MADAADHHEGRTGSALEHLHRRGLLPTRQLVGVDPMPGPDQLLERGDQQRRGHPAPPPALDQPGGLVGIDHQGWFTGAGAGGVGQPADGVVGPPRPGRADQVELGPLDQPVVGGRDHRVGQRQARAAAGACPRRPRTVRPSRPPARPRAAPRPVRPARGRPRAGGRRAAVRGPAPAGPRSPAVGWSPPPGRSPPRPRPVVPGFRPRPGAGRPGRAGRPNRSPRRRPAAAEPVEQVQRRSLSQRVGDLGGHRMGQGQAADRESPAADHHERRSGGALQHLHRRALGPTGEGLVVDRASLAQQPFQDGRQQARPDPTTQAAVDQEDAIVGTPDQMGVVVEPSPPSPWATQARARRARRGAAPTGRASFDGSWSGSAPRVADDRVVGDSAERASSWARSCSLRLAMARSWRRSR